MGKSKLDRQKEYLYTGANVAGQGEVRIQQQSNRFVA